MVLKGTERHELSCSNCGAPLHDLKKLPKRKVVERKVSYSGNTGFNERKPRKKKRKKSLFSRALDEAWDVIEDIFD